MKKIKIYLVRHGQVNHNANNTYNNEDEDLNETGINQLDALKEIINSIDYDIVISSPLLRAKHTASIINCKNKNIIIDERLRERDPGSLNGQSMEVTNRDEYWNYYSKIKYGTSENIKLFFDKVYDFLEELKNKNYNSVIIVSHSGISRAFYSYFYGIPQDGSLLKCGLKNAEIKEYTLNN